MSAAINSLAALLGAAAATTIMVEVQGLGTVLVRRLTAGDRIALSAIPEAEREARLGLWLVTRSLVDQLGNRLMTDNDEDKAAAMDATIVDALVSQIISLNKLAQDPDAAKN